MDSLADIIMCRRSVRTYAGTPLSEKDILNVRSLLADISNPFGANPAVRLVEVGPKGVQIPGTYGMIKGARNYLLMGYGDSVNDALAAGFSMERVVLGVTALGLGTCWVGGTFKSSDFSRIAEFSEAQRLKIVLPVGTPADKPRILERIGWMLMKSAQRKPFGAIFFDGSFSNPMTFSDASVCRALEMMRLAPSSTNSQPWRAVVVETSIHFYYKPGAFAILNCGIGLCHFSMMMAVLGVKGAWNFSDDHPEPAVGLNYLVTLESADLSGN